LSKSKILRFARTSASIVCDTFTVGTLRAIAFHQIHDIVATFFQRWVVTAMRLGLDIGSVGAILLPSSNGVKIRPLVTASIPARNSRIRNNANAE
jgi:hypothetical protein